MDYQLDINDNEILSFLTDSSNFKTENLLENIDKDTKDEKELVKLLPSIIMNMQKKNKIEYLIKLFNMLYPYKDDDMVVTNLKTISKSIIKYFSNSKYNTNFPRNLFNYNFLEFAISQNNYFNNYRGINYSVFSILLHSKKTLDYFNIVILPEYYDEHVDFIEKLFNVINREVLSYSNISPSLVTKSLNIISLVSDYIEIDEDCTDLIEKTQKLYMLIYSATCETISLNKESKKIYQYISSKFTLSNKEYNPILKQIDNDIKGHLSTLNILRLNKFLSNKIIKKLENFDVEDNNNENYDELIRILPYTMNEKLFMGINYTNYIEKCTKYVSKILDSDHVNIHHKCKFILETDIKLYDKNIEQLINLFINIEPFNPDSGFNDKSKVRNKIINIIINLDKIDYLSTTDDKTFNEFITLFTAHVNDIMCRIIKYKKELLKKYSSNPTNISQLLLIKYMLYLSTSSELFQKFNDLNKDKLNKEFYYKQAELLFSIIKYSVSNNIYNEITNNKSTSINKFMEASCSEMLKKIYGRIYNYLLNLTKEEKFIRELACNSDFYNKDDITETINSYGEIKFENGNTIKEILELYITKVDEEIKNINEKKENYSEDIPVKFKDPILFSVIKEPLEIPEVKQILDKYTIMNHLTFSETNPFTNKELTKEKLLEYNSQAEVKERIDKFIEEFNKWKSQHKI